MTVESPINKSGPFIASGAIGVFPRNFLVFDPAHVRVVRSRDGVETDITTGISHSGMGSASGTVTLTQGIQAGDRITLLRNMPNVQRSDYSAQSSVPTDQVELDLDLLAMQVQDLAERQARALTLPVDSTQSGEEAMRAALAAPRYALEAKNASDAITALNIESLPTLLLSTRTYPDGTVLSARDQGHTYRVVSSDPDLTTASGIGLRVLPTRGTYDLRAFGAKPDGSDCSPAVTRWLMAVIANKGTGYLPAGDWTLNSAVQMAVGQVQFSIRGDGEGNSRFIVPAGNTVGGILIRGSNRGSTVRLSDFAVIKRGQGGIGFEFSEIEGGNQHQKTLIVRNVSARGENGTTDRFDVFLRFKAAFNPVFENIVVDGPHVGLSADFTDASPRYAAAIGLDLDGCYNPKVVNPQIWGVNRAITSRALLKTVTAAASGGATRTDLTVDDSRAFTTGFKVVVGNSTVPAYNGEWIATRISDTVVAIPVSFAGTATAQIGLESEPEAFTCTTPALVNVNIGIDYQRNFGREPTVWVTDGHFNFRDSAIRIRGAKEVILRHNICYNEDSDNVFSGVPIDFHLPDVADFLIEGNCFYFAGAPDRVNLAVYTEGNGETGRHGRICNNQFGSNGTWGVWLSSNTQNIVCGPNLWTGNYSVGRMNDLSSVNTLVDDAVVQEGTFDPGLSFGNGTTGIVYAARSGAWRIVGNVLHVQADITLSNKGTSTGTAEISIPSSWPGIRNPQTGGALQWIEWSGMSGLTMPGGRLVTSNRIRLTQAGAVLSPDLTDANFTNTSRVRVYLTALMT